MDVIELTNDVELIELFDDAIEGLIVVDISEHVEVVVL